MEEKIEKIEILEAENGPLAGAFPANMKQIAELKAKINEVIDYLNTHK